MVNSTSELYSFMDSADSTLALKVLGELDENGEPVGAHTEGGKTAYSIQSECCVPLPGCEATVQFMHHSHSAVHALSGQRALAYCSHCCCLPCGCAGEADAKKTEQQTRALYDILSCVRDVRKRSDRTDAMFEPLKDTAALLQAFGINLGDSVLKQLDKADLRWDCRPCILVESVCGWHSSCNAAVVYTFPKPLLSGGCCLLWRSGSCAYQLGACACCAQVEGPEEEDAQPQGAAGCPAAG